MCDVLDCRRCGCNKPASEFRADHRYRRGYASWCAECHRARNKEWAVENRARLTAKAATWRANNPEKVKEINAAHNSLHKARRLQQSLDYCKANRGLRAALTQNRKAAKLRATPQWANQKKIKAIYKQAAAITRSTGIQMHVDHIVPLRGMTVCGLHWEDNLRIISAAENIAKKNKWADQWSDMFVAIPPTQEVLI